MRFPGRVAFVVLASLLIGNAARAGEVASAAAACDFFQAQLLGLLCGGTGYVAPAVGGDDLTYGRTTVRPPRFHGDPTVMRTDRWDDRQTFEDATAAVSPWQGVRFHVTGEAFQYGDRDSYDVLVSGGFRGLADLPTKGGGDISGVAKWGGAYGGWQSFGAEATIFDRQTDFGRYVLNAIGGFGYFSGGGVYGSRDRQRIGWESGARWGLGGTGLSLDYGSETLLQRLDNPGEIQALSQSRLLIASDRYGVALGPLLDVTSELWHAAGYNTGWSEARLGVDALAAPFRLTQIPILRDMTLEASAEHSVGQAGLVPVWAGRSNGYDFAGSARFNFRY